MSQNTNHYNTIKQDHQCLFTISCESCKVFRPSHLPQGCHFLVRHWKSRVIVKQVDGGPFEVVWRWENRPSTCAEHRVLHYIWIRRQSRCQGHAVLGLHGILSYVLVLPSVSVWLSRILLRPSDYCDWLRGTPSSTVPVRLSANISSYLETPYCEWLRHPPPV